uniref:Gamma-tubulin complex component n=1 Tax=Ananas comosus var. bracteatus TaxID=296719 RepID=A0A6V7QFE4_ANACO|nr:unnamed protein product [Ananas comosus var. bracteatus]
MAGTVVANYGLGKMSSYSFDSLPDWRFYEQVENGKQSTSLPQRTAVTNDDDCGLAKVEDSDSFITKLHFSITKGLHHAAPISSFRIDEHELVRAVLQMLQGFCSDLFYWDEAKQGFLVKDGIYASHLSQTSLKGILNIFLFAGTCLKRVEIFVTKVGSSGTRTPTLSAFANSVYSWLKRLREVALKEEEQLLTSDTDNRKTMTLLGLTNSLSSLCAGAELLWELRTGAVPNVFIDSGNTVSSSEIAVYILNHLFKKLNEDCLVQGDSYHMLLAIFTGSLLPYLHGLDSWLYDGILDDPCEEMFFYKNVAVSIDQPAFWETSYLLRTSRLENLISSGGSLIRTGIESNIKIETSNQDDMDIAICPIFLNDIGKAIVSAGKSLQLVQHVQDECAMPSDSERCQFPDNQNRMGHRPEVLSSLEFVDGNTGSDDSGEESFFDVQISNDARIMGVLTLPEVFLVSLAGLLDDGDHIYEYFKMFPTDINLMSNALMNNQYVEKGINKNIKKSLNYDKNWLQFLVDAMQGRRHVGINERVAFQSMARDSDSSTERNKIEERTELSDSSFFPGNPVITVCRDLLQRNFASWDGLNLSRSFHLPPLNDENLREAIFGFKYSDATMNDSSQCKAILPRLDGTDYTFGFQFDELQHLRLDDDRRTLETLFAFPTLLPSFQEDITLSEILPSQKDSTLASKVLNFIQSIKLKDPPEPAVIIQECLSLYIRKQVVDHIGKHILSKLMDGWRLMDELFVLRAIFFARLRYSELLSDLLQQFWTVIFNRLDKGDSWDDDFELNTILQESVRNSADRTLLSAPDSLVVSVTISNASDDEENMSTPRKLRNQFLGVSWPLDLIVNMEALKKYNQVMGFLLKVKRAKFVLDKARKWMWKGKGNTAQNYKHHLLLAQKLLHFVDAFHQYVMDRVFHSAWNELCSGMAAARSLDEVIEVHEAYLLSIQRQCFVSPDKLWALIASRLKTILGLGLEFYSIQQTLSSGGAATSVKARCEMEIERIEKQFDDCVAFLLRILSFKLNVGHFPHLADLVTRINYNYFYMSEKGNLLTVPGFESSAKAGKAPTFRA